jgi:hypothetical protein
MPEYHQVIVSFPGGKEVRGAIKGDTLPPDLARLSYVYGIKVKIGGRVKGPELARLVALDRKPLIPRRRPTGMRLLSPDFGRGSGGPI